MEFKGYVFPDDPSQPPSAWFVRIGAGNLPGARRPRKAAGENRAWHKELEKQKRGHSAAEAHRWKKENSASYVSKQHRLDKSRAQADPEI